MLMELVGKLRFLKIYGELETVKTGDSVEASSGAAVGASGAGLVSIVSFLTIFFMFTE